MSISIKDFQTIKQGTKVQFNRGGKLITIIASGKPRSVKNGTIQKATFKNVDNLNGCKYFMYYYISKNYVSLAFGDMSANVENLTFF